MILTSKQNPKFKEALKLWERRERDRTRTFLIEGYRELLRAQAAGQPIERLFYCPELFLGVNEPALLASCQAEKIRCDERLFRALSYRDRPDGLLAIGQMTERLLTSLPEEDHPLYVVAEAIEKPGNLGTILRSADAAKASGVIVCDKCTDLYNPNVVRASCGTLFTQPVVEAKGEEVIQWLQARKIPLVAATPSAKVEYTEVDLRSAALLVGTEQLGLTKRLLEAATVHVRIPMHGVADSLNVATATTLLLYEALRQRKHGS